MASWICHTFVNRFLLNLILLLLLLWWPLLVLFWGHRIHNAPPFDQLNALWFWYWYNIFLMVNKTWLLSCGKCWLPECSAQANFVMNLSQSVLISRSETFWGKIHDVDTFVARVVLDWVPMCQPLNCCDDDQSSFFL